MGAAAMLRGKLEGTLAFMHTKRRGALWRLVDGLLRGQQLWLTELGRSLPGACSIKHRVKAVDRFVGGAAIQVEMPKIYAALANYLLRSAKRAIILVDWTGAGRGFYTLSAQIAFQGRALTILARTYPEKKKANPEVERAFLDELKTIIPAGCRPVLVTDAGFLFKWVDSVRALGWDYVGRARFKRMHVNFRGQCMRVADVYGLARRKPRDLGVVFLGKLNPRPHRAIVSARPKRSGRKSLNLKGKPRANGVAVKCEAQAREPLFLISSLQEPAKVIVDIYRTRMQIEQTFRDLKSHRYGWASRHIRSATTRRVDVLLLVAALAAIAMHLIGLAVCRMPIARGLQVNTEHGRAVFSSFFLGRLALREGITSIIDARSLREAAKELLAKVKSLDRVPTA